MPRCRVVHIAFMTVEDGITVADKEKMRVLVYDKGVNISHAMPNEIISVYTIDGRIVATKKSDYNGTASFALEKGKVYLIKTKEKTIKFAI